MADCQNTYDTPMADCQNTYDPPPVWLKKQGNHKMNELITLTQAEKVHGLYGVDTEFGANTPLRNFD